MEHALTSLQPGDVLLTTRVGAIPALLRAASGAAVSHAAIMVTPEYAIEARDDAWDLSEEGGRIYVRSITEIVEHPELALLVVRRPPEVDRVALLDWAIHAVRSEATFGNAALALAPVLKVRAELATAFGRLAMRVPHPILTAVHDHLESSAARWAEAVADGFSSVICTEVVYRALHAAGCELELEDAYMADAMLHLPAPSAVEFRPVDNAEATFAQLANDRHPEPDVQLGGPKTTSQLMFKSVRNLRRRGTLRFTSRPDGDHADLITPADLLRLPPLTTSFVARRNDSGEMVIVEPR